jgi:hypothetical protein
MKNCRSCDVIELKTVPREVRRVQSVVVDDNTRRDNETT